MGRSRWVFFFMLVSSCRVLGQQNSSGDSTAVLLGIKGHSGYILAHSSSIAHLTQSRPWGFQADISRVRYTQKSWNACNCYSRNGISVSYFNFNNPEVLGSAFSLALFAEPQLTYGTISVSLRAGIGLSYLTRVYHPDKNPENLFFSDPWSGLLLAQMNARYRLSQTWLLRLEAAYRHISNGGKSQPNKGMNFPSIGLGVDHALKYATPSRRQKSALSNKSVRYYGGVSYNTRSVDESAFETSERKAVIGLFAGFYKPFARMHGAGVGLEAAHDRALKAQAQYTGSSFDHHVISALVTHHLLFGRFDFSQALGIYLHKEYPTPHEVFQRYALHYRLADRVRAGFSLKAHLHTAEQMDIRVGVVF